jgi:hypothetical protein
MRYAYRAHSDGRSARSVQTACGDLPGFGVDDSPTTSFSVTHNDIPASKALYNKNRR